MTIYRGGTDEERLYLHPAKFDCKGDICIVKPTEMPFLPELIQRHKSRYYFVSSFYRFGDSVLDFPCGSGYGASIIPSLYYEGRDNDEVSIEYAKLFYKGVFKVDDLTNPHLPERFYDLIACVEGLEHIEQVQQQRLIKYFYDSLVHGGTLVITSPEKKEEITNPYHKWELKRNEFVDLLHEQFKDVQVLMVKDENHKGEKTNFMYGVARKDD